jgi:hypothetical protein
MKDKTDRTGQGKHDNKYRTVGKKSWGQDNNNFCSQFCKNVWNTNILAKIVLLQKQKFL